MTLQSNIVNICPKCKRPGDIIEDPNVDSMGYYNVSYSHEDGTICDAGRAIEMDRLLADTISYKKNNKIRMRRPKAEAIVGPCPKCHDHREGRHFLVKTYENRENWVCYHNDIQIPGYWNGPYGPFPKTRRCSYFKITDTASAKISLEDSLSKDNAPIDEICPIHKTMARRFIAIETNRSGTKRKRLTYEHRDGEATMSPTGRKRWPRCYVNDKIEDKPKQEHQKIEKIKVRFKVRPILYNKFRTQAKENKLKLTEAIEQALILWTLQTTRKIAEIKPHQGAPIIKK